MIIAHLPSGYILGRALGVSTPLAMGAVLLGAVLPDFDLIWFFFVDDRAIHHHRYWVHAPGFWALLTLALAPVLWWLGRRAQVLWALLMAGVLVHCILDTATGGIMWAWPVSGDLMHLITVPAVRGHWLLNFILHWTFLAELAICAVAGVLFWRARRNG